jgi:hypothetical protein
MKTIKTAFLMSLIALGPLSTFADTATISGTGLSTLSYNPNDGSDGGIAEYVAGTPDVAYLYTPDSSVSGDSPAVKVKAGNVGFSLGTLNTFFADYALESGSGGLPYFLTYLNAPNGGYVGVISFAGPDFDASSQIHVIYYNASSSGTYWGDTLSQLDSISYEGTTFGQLPVYETIVEIGDGGSGPETANIESITVSTPDVASTMSLLGIGFGALVGLRRRLNRA